MIHIRTMTADDVPLGMRLRAQARFNQTEADWHRFLELQPDGCFVAELEGEPVGTVTNCLFDSIGWIAMLLVDKRVRGRGIGTRLTQHALAYLDARGVRTARLDATPRGRPIYEKLGFVAEYELVRLEGTAQSGGSRHAVRPNNLGTVPIFAQRKWDCPPPESAAAPQSDGSRHAVRPAAADQLDALLRLDRQVTGTRRDRLIRRLYEEQPDAMHLFHGKEKIEGYLTFRDGTNAAQIGPGVALSPEAGRALGGVVLGCCAGRTVFVDVPTDNAPAIEWAESNGLAVQRPFTRMRRGEPVVDQPSQLWASSGPEKG